METANVLTHIAEFRSALRAMGRHIGTDTKKWSATYDALFKAQSMILRSKPTNYAEASAMLDFIARELGCWEHPVIEKLADELKRPRGDLKKGRFEWLTWTHIDLVVQKLTQYIPDDAQLRPFRRGLRAVCDFIKAEGGRPDPRKLSIKIVLNGPVLPACCRDEQRAGQKHAARSD